MASSLEFLLKHGVAFLFAWVFVEQLGVPIPAIPMLLAAGALAGSGRSSLASSLAVAVAAAILADFIWYSIGRRKGIHVLHLLCRISLEPDSCVRRTQGVFAKHGARSLLFAKFVPGLNTVATPLAGVFHMRPPRFLLYDTAGAVLWAGGLIGVGFAFSNQIGQVAARAAAFGGTLFALLLAALAAYIAWKFVARQRFIRQLRIARITPRQLKEKIDSGEDIVVVDLRHSMDFEAAPESIPGAVHLEAKDLEANTNLLPRDREIVLFCT
ncbi:MAG TPA: VTT domain-containing protein [Methylomirabilota bacterium]|nr:VTT domain-containing protein [Methylomirabilota bacterium]